jgi:hypothetical protein
MEPKKTRPPRWSSLLRLLAGIGTLALGVLYPFTGVAASGADALPLPITNDQSVMTNGILALGVILVVIVIVGVLLGSRGAGGKKPK